MKAEHHPLTKAEAEEFERVLRVALSIHPKSAAETDKLRAQLESMMVAYRDAAITVDLQTLALDIVTGKWDEERSRAGWLYLENENLKADGHESDTSAPYYFGFSIRSAFEAGAMWQAEREHAGQLVYSFRSECQRDVELFIAGIVTAGFKIRAFLRRDSDGLPDVDVEIVTDASLEQLLEIVRSVEDAHVILQTLRQVPLMANSLKREYGLR